jgi:hypothetical protein
VSRAALKNPDRKRTFHEIEIPSYLRDILEPGTRAFLMARCRILVGEQKAGWHLSISKQDKLPSWEEVRDARYELIPDEATMALLLPARSEYVNVHEFTLQMYEIPAEYIADYQDRL